MADSTTGGEGQGAVTWADGDDPLRLVPLEPQSEEMDPAEVLPGPDPDDPDSTTGGSDGPRRRIQLLPIFRFGKRRTDS
ncbi:MAG: hypothetical protein M1126_01670 [Candidatus Thermoplasmatota archaeon]|nr:hypothetical protein [Candidatus Thermoplasmatota archaeon]